MIYHTTAVAAGSLCLAMVLYRCLFGINLPGFLLWFEFPCRCQGAVGNEGPAEDQTLLLASTACPVMDAGTKTMTRATRWWCVCAVFACKGWKLQTTCCWAAFSRWSSGQGFFKVYTCRCHRWQATISDALVEWWLSQHSELLADVRKGFESLVLLTAWCIWGKRNQRVFKGIYPGSLSRFSRRSSKRETLGSRQDTALVLLLAEPAVWYLSVMSQNLYCIIAKSNSA
jgi:hypothetical protein